MVRISICRTSVSFSAPRYLLRRTGVQRETSDGMGILDQIQPSDPRFSTELLSEVHAFGRNFCAETDERWSLVDCGLIEAHWEKILHWARTCRGADIPRPNSRAAGLLL